MKRFQSGLAQRRQQLSSGWATLPVTQRRWLGLGVLSLAGLAVWLLALAPALATWRDAPAQHQQLDAKLQAMQSQAQALKVLQGQPRADPSRAVAALKASLKPLGEASDLTLDGTRATVQLKGVAATALADWLTNVRLSSQAVPIEAELNRSPNGPFWSGRVVLALPQP
jgi:general secretion pathway protein M